MQSILLPPPTLSSQSACRQSTWHPCGMCALLCVPCIAVSSWQALSLTDTACLDRWSRLGGSSMANPSSTTLSGPQMIFKFTVSAAAELHSMHLGNCLACMLRTAWRVSGGGPLQARRV